MRCTACDSVTIPGIDHCVNCGEPVGALEISFADGDGTIDDAQIARWESELRWARFVSQRTTEGRALEIAGDAETAIAIYEQLVTAGCGFPEPFRRLAILYRKAKRRSDEERIVRKALAVLGPHTNQWFILRLAKLLSSGTGSASTPS